MNGFTKKTVGTMSLGEKLKKLRSDKRISLGEVSRFTKIQVSYLEYIEEGEYDRLPADVYVKGFLRSYAYFLGVDEDILLRLYEREKEIRKNLNEKKKIEEPKKNSINISSFIFTPKKIIILAIFLVIALGLFFLYREIDSFSSAPNLVILSPENDSSILTNSIYVEGTTDKDATLFINKQPILVNDNGRFRENLILQPGLNSIEVKSVNKFGKESIQEVSVNYDFKGEERSNSSSEENQDSNEEKKLKIDVRVDPGPVWLSVEADEELVFSGTMLTGAVQSFEAKEKISIDSGRGEATFLKFNGQDIGALSQDPGAVREVTFTKDTKF